jgi:hypothetical protein
MGFHLAKVVAKLGNGVVAGGQPKGVENRLVDVATAPSVQLRATMWQNFHQSHQFQILQIFVKADVLQAIHTDFHPQEGAELFVHAAYQFPAVGPHHVMAVIQFLQHAIHFVGCQAEPSDFAGLFKDLVDWKAFLEDEVPTVFDLVDRIFAA